MVRVIKGIINKVESQDMVNLNGRMVQSMKGNFLRIIFMEKVRFMSNGLNL